MYPNSRTSAPNPMVPMIKTHINSNSTFKIRAPQITTPMSPSISRTITYPIAVHTHNSNSPLTLSTQDYSNPDEAAALPSMSEIMESSRLQKLDLRLQTLGPYFRVTAISVETKRELGRAEGFTRYWLGGKILHLDSIRLQKETLGMEKSIFGIGLFIGAVAIRHGFDNGCRTAELLAINDSDLYHSKLVRFYTRMGFRKVYEVTGSSVGDLSHLLLWGGRGTRMDADIEGLLKKWAKRFKSQK
ncbi:hypothetical protein Sjap_010169 [Stephania japonica]|uniref:Uncharacterized protein n=1 Tax=Stephania japonica TaxID=461633 RepID=A0AAP0P3D8_9MAGN